MRVLHVSTTDGTGGASRAAQRLHQGLRLAGVESRMVVGEITAGEAGAERIITAAGDRLAPALSAERLSPKISFLTGEVTLPYPSSHLLRRSALFRRADVIHLHNLHGNFFDYRVLHRWSLEKPLVWTLHDMWPFTGHCAYSFGCELWRSRSGCGPCPLFEPQNKHLDDIPQPPWDNSGSVWRRKRSLYADTPIAVTAPSAWLLNLAAESLLASHPQTSFNQIPYGLDTDVYRPISRHEARRALDLDPEAELVFFSAATLTQERKGLRYLLDALRIEELAGRKLGLITFGAQPELPTDLDRVSSSFGPVADGRTQALLYSAADLAIVPSLADNQPLVALEAMACGVPVISFRVGGLPELVEERGAGICVPSRDARALADAISEILDDGDLRRRLSEQARHAVLAHHTLGGYAEAYAQIYERSVAALD